MSLYGVMRSGVSGMNAQSSKLGTVADNIQNASTTGYKRASSEFASLISGQGNGKYVSGGVEAKTRYAISDPGNVAYTTSRTDLAVEGNGFFVVADRDGTPALTRAGAFVPDGDGNLVNTAGYYLQGYSLANGAPNVVANALTGLENVNISQLQLEADPSTEGTFNGNLPSNAAIVAAADLPSANAATATMTAKSSLVSYDNLGNEVMLDVYLTKSAETTLPGPPPVPVDATWEVTIYNKADADPVSGGFPYGAAALGTTSLIFDQTTGNLTGASPTDISFTIPNGQPMVLSMAQMTQLAADYEMKSPYVNGNPPVSVERVEIGDDGTLYSIYENGMREASYKIPLADVPSPDNLTPMSGNVYQASITSGDVRVGFPGEGGLGSIASGALEQSNVDLASELTNMIEAQRSFTANSKVFQTGSDLLNELVNLKR